MEENKEKPSTVNVMKVAGMGPTGGIGDAIDHMTLMPLTLALGASIAMEGSIAGPFVFFFLYQIVHFFSVFRTDVYGLSRAGTAAMVNMSDATEKLAKAANIMGIFCYWCALGDLLSKYKPPPRWNLAEKSLNYKQPSSTKLCRIYCHCA